MQRDLAQRFGRVPDAVDYPDALELAAGQTFAQREVSVILVELLVSQQRRDGSWNIRPLRWHAADFDHMLSHMLQHAHEEIVSTLRCLPRKPFDVVYFGEADEAAEAALLAAGRDWADRYREIAVVTLPGALAIADLSFRRVDAVADLGAFPGLDFTRLRSPDRQSAGLGARCSWSRSWTRTRRSICMSLGTDRCSTRMRRCKRQGRVRLGGCELLGRFGRPVAEGVR